ncbi:iron-containing alcohol dehydrogenase [Bacillus niameyensis]|uniref:iron-containing alcohol dehydrogenase n=1 Tax=Bacillus niameyensis TaxID=1522308 RepID=UPI000785E208|nr:iron-containing alcohol dehydrogenase [Bacillus niameyensis]
MMYYLPSKNLLGRGCLNDLGEEIKNFDFKKALVVTDKFLSDSGIVKRITNELDQIDVQYIIYDEVEPNPTTEQVNKGLQLLQKESCDFILSVGGGSPQDCASAISILATNGGNVRDYEGVHKSQNLGFPTIAVNTTAGTSAELTINYVITDEDRGVKMVCVDKNSLALLSVSDPEIMISKPRDLTAATGMDALTHAIEAIVTPGANTITDATALEAVRIIFDYLPSAVENGEDIEAREQLTYACFLAGMAFSNAGLGFVHAMAHQLGGIYNLPHGVCNAMLLPVVERENTKHAPEKFRLIAEKLDYKIDKATDEEVAQFVIDEIIALSEEVGIPKSLKELGVENPDLELLADNSLKDACAPGNPFMPTKEQTMEMFKEIV